MRGCLVNAIEACKEMLIRTIPARQLTTTAAASCPSPRPCCRRRGNRRLKGLNDVNELRSSFLHSFEPALDYAIAADGAAAVDWDATMLANHA